MRSCYICGRPLYDEDEIPYGYLDNNQCFKCQDILHKISCYFFSHGGYALKITSKLAYSKVYPKNTAFKINELRDLLGDEIKICKTGAKNTVIVVPVTKTEKLNKYIDIVFKKQVYNDALIINTQLINFEEEC